jgi:hypothetical protein
VAEGGVTVSEIANTQLLMFRFFRAKVAVTQMLLAATRKNISATAMANAEELTM